MTTYDTLTGGWPSPDPEDISNHPITAPQCDALDLPWGCTSIAGHKREGHVCWDRWARVIRHRWGTT